jgi:hypothetical protein
MLALTLIAAPACAQYYEQLFTNASTPQAREVKRPQPAHAIVWDLGACSGALSPDLRIEGSYDRQVWTEIGARLVMVRPDQNGRCTAIQTAPYFTPYVRARIVSTPQPVSAWYASSEVAPPTIMVNVPGPGAYVYAYNATRGGTYSYTVGDTRTIEVRGPAGATVIERGTWGGSPYEETLGTVPSTGWFRVGQVVTATGKVVTTIIFSLPGDMEAPGPPLPPFEVTP